MLQNKEKMSYLADHVVSFLRICLKIGRCYIVTNGQQGWVERSCQLFLPAVFPLLDHVTIISARHRYEAKYPRCPVDWKIAAFSDLFCPGDPLKATENDPLLVESRQVIAIGDSSHDRSAIQYVANRTNHIQLKSIKFLENPTIHQLQKQIELITGFMVQLSTHDEPLDLILSTDMLQ